MTDYERPFRTKEARHLLGCLGGTEWDEENRYESPTARMIREVEDAAYALAEALDVERLAMALCEESHGLGPCEVMSIHRKKARIIAAEYEGWVGRAPDGTALDPQSVAADVWSVIESARLTPDADGYRIPTQAFAVLNDLHSRLTDE